MRRNLLLVVLIAALIASVQSIAFAEVKFNDNLVRFQPNFGTGSSTEALARIIGPMLSKTLPGNPQVIVEPIPGGGGTKLAKKMLKQKGDGHSAGLIAILHLTASLGRPMPIKLNKLKNVGSFVFPTIILVRENLGLKTLKDVLNYKKELIIAASKPNAPGISPFRTWLIANKVKHRIVGGYAGQPACVAALQAGEVDITPLTSTLYIPLKKTYNENGAVALVQNGNHNSAGGADLSVAEAEVMTLDEAWKKYTPQTVGSDEYKTFRFILKSYPMVMHVAMPPGTPDEYLKAWRKAFLEVFKTPAFKKYLKETNSPNPIVISGEQVDAQVKEMGKAKTDPVIQSVIKSLKKKSL